MRGVPSTQESLRRKGKIGKLPGFEEGAQKDLEVKEVTIVSVILGTLGMVSISRLRKRLEALDVAKEVELLLGTARILRRVLDTGY